MPDPGRIQYAIEQAGFIGVYTEEAAAEFITSFIKSGLEQNTIEELDAQVELLQDHVNRTSERYRLQMKKYKKLRQKHAQLKEEIVKYAKTAQKSPYALMMVCKFGGLSILMRILQLRGI